MPTLRPPGLFSFIELASFSLEKLGSNYFVPSANAGGIKPLTAIFGSKQFCLLIVQRFWWGGCGGSVLEVIQGREKNACYLLSLSGRPTPTFVVHISVEIVDFTA